MKKTEFRLGEFTFLETEDRALVEAIHRLRYQIYVQEYGFEKPEDHPGGMERDIYDPHAVSIAALDRKGNLVGTARLIHHCPFPLPAFELAAPDWREKHKADPGVVESSRFAMSRDFRWSAMDFKREMAFYRRVLGLGPATSPQELAVSAGELSARVLIFLGLSHATIASAKARGASWHLMAAERSLWVMLKRNGMRFEPIGPEVDYHGRRTPYAGDNEEMFRSTQAVQERVVGLLARAADAVPVGVREESLAEGETFRLGGTTFGVAVTPAVVGRVYRLRHRVYVEDFELMPPAVDGLDRDPFDGWSLHVTANDADGRLVGTVRLVLNSPLGLPCLEKARPEERNRLLSSKKVAELSRLALVAPYGVAFADVLAYLLSMPLVPRGPFVLNPGDRRRAAVITLGLFRMLYRMSKKLRLSGWVTLAHGETIALLSRHGIHPEILGPEDVSKDHRQPVLLRLADLEGPLTDFARIRAFSKDASFHGGQAPDLVRNE